VRGAEVLEMLQAMNTGHDGSMATIHASSPRECLYRLEMLAGFAGFAGSELSLRADGVGPGFHRADRPPAQRQAPAAVHHGGGGHGGRVALQELYRHESQGGQVDSWHSLGAAADAEAGRLEGRQRRTGHGRWRGWPL
jgi:pilus assembly protein CpaF